MALARTFFTDMDRVFEDMTRGLASQGVGFGAVDAHVDVESGRLTALFDLPGIDHDSLGVRVAGDALVVEARRTPRELGQRHKVLAAERGAGAVRRIFRTGLALDADSVVASFDDGVLTVQAGTRTPGRTVQVSFGESSSQQSITTGTAEQARQDG